MYHAIRARENIEGYNTSSLYSLFYGQEIFL